MIYGVVLAAGLSTRMGTEKLLLPIGGESMVEATAGRVNAVCDRTLVVVKPQFAGQFNWDGNTIEVVNDQPGRGQASSVAAAVEWIMEHDPEAESALFFPGDMPMFDLDCAHRVYERAKGNPQLLVVGRFAGSLCNPCAFGAKWFAELAELNGDVGGRQVIRRHPEAVEYVDFPKLPGCDIDTFQDYLEATLGRRDLVVMRGAGDIATGSIARLHSAGFPVVALDIEQPTVIRRTISFAQALFDGRTEVEGIVAVRCETLVDIAYALVQGQVPVVVDPAGSWIARLKPAAVVDAILAKVNCGTTTDMAPVVVALGPGFTAGQDCHAVIETKRGHTLGSIIYDGSAIPNSGIPGIIAGYGAERVIHAPATGTIHLLHDIGDHVEQGECIAMIDDVEVHASLTGCLRGMIASGMHVDEGLKIADVDPRDVSEYCNTISDKARAVGGGCLEAVMHLLAARRQGGEALDNVTAFDAERANRLAKSQHAQ